MTEGITTHEIPRTYHTTMENGTYRCGVQMNNLLISKKFKDELIEENTLDWVR